jgi:23S rRNA (guanosine2251-2'-O)-methyltransferase
MDGEHPRDRLITIFGKKPVLEALGDPALAIERVFLVKGDRSVSAIVRLAEERRVPIERRTADGVARISRDARHDQGVAADVRAPRMQALASWLDDVRGPRKRETHHVLLLDGVSNPQNVGMILRTAVAFGLGGVVLPRKGSPEVGPYVVKASAGVAFRAPILRAATALEAVEALKGAGFRLLGLRAAAGAPIATAAFESRTAFVLGNETVGTSAEVAEWIDAWAHVPMAGPAESLNVAVAAAVVAYEISRRGS